MLVSGQQQHRQHQHNSMDNHECLQSMHCQLKGLPGVHVS